MSQEKIESRCVFIKKLGKLAAVAVAVSFIVVFANAAHAFNSADQQSQQVQGCMEASTDCFESEGSENQTAINENRFVFDNAVGFVDETSDQSYTQADRIQKIKRLKQQIEVCKKQVAYYRRLEQEERAKDRVNPDRITMGISMASFYAERRIEWEGHRDMLQIELNSLQGY